MYDAETCERNLNGLDFDTLTRANHVFVQKWFAEHPEAVDSDSGSLQESMFDDKDEYETNYEKISVKTVPDIDGFMTDYTWYRDSRDGNNVFVFGDADYNPPEDGYFDWETYNDQEAQEWFDNYHGFEDEDGDVEFPMFEVFNRVVESGNTRIHRHILGEEPWAMLSAFRANYSEAENLERMSRLKADVRKLGYGYIQFLSKWVENGESSDERALLIPKCTAEDAISLGKKFEQSSVIIRDADGCREICTTPFETYVEGVVVRTYNISDAGKLNIADAEEIFAERRGGPASKPMKGSNPKAFHLSEVYEIEDPRPSYFQTHESKTLLWKQDKKET